MNTEPGGLRATGSALPQRIREHNLTLVAAGVAFYAFLAFVPALIAFISIYGLVADPDDVARQVEDVASALPQEVQDFLVFQLTSIIKANNAGVSITLLIAIVLALWSASGGMAALDHRHPRRPRARRAEELRRQARQGAAADRSARSCSSASSSS